MVKCEHLCLMPFNLKSKGLTISVFLQPANEVWGKVMFLHLSVSHSIHRGLPRGCLHRGGCLHPRGSASRGWGVGQTLPVDTTGYSKRAGGTHPTGMHSSSFHVNRP